MMDTLACMFAAALFAVIYCVAAPAERPTHVKFQHQLMAVAR
jgi:hypothetical protein